MPDGARPVLESRDRHARPMPADPFASIYGDLNWDAPRGPRRCEECGLGEPVAGAYPSALFHFEEVLGDLGGDRSDARLTTCPHWQECRACRCSILRLEVGANRTPGVSSNSLLRTGPGSSPWPSMSTQLRRAGRPTRHVTTGRAPRRCSKLRTRAFCRPLDEYVGSDIYCRL